MGDVVRERRANGAGTERVPDPYMLSARAHLILETTRIELQLALARRLTLFAIATETWTPFDCRRGGVYVDPTAGSSRATTAIRFLSGAADSPFRAVTLLVDPALVVAPPGPLLLDTETWCAARAFEPGVLVGRLVAAHILRSEASAEVGRSEPGATRLWTALEGFFARGYFSPSLDELAVSTGLSARHVGREVAAFIQCFHLPWSGWREASREVRFRLALLLLSGPPRPLACIARAVGYASAETMAQAFYGAGFAAPSHVRWGMQDPTARATPPPANEALPQDTVATNGARKSVRSVCSGGSARARAQRQKPREYEQLV